MYLVDTNVLILAISKQDPDYSFLQKIITKKQLILSVIPVAEFLSQSSEGEDMELERLLAAFQVLGVDLKVAQLAGEYRKKFLKQRRIQLLDYFIAAQAKLHNLTLVTNNKADFPMKDIKIISP
ncbi:MAG: putative ribonuclease VapC [Candidatus Daviesbacteria bacterium GW2011_GWA1_41_61]|uniref:Putative ribonuclease VapC n=1 Tax=Candidatus Daviesbacteria bacterium GW2011_GWA2_40_9 TaxID=1618424 RepID=A0A0G0U3P3_9BACT|nr:MAG: hypothetical protein UU26_C0008G0006 [Candidatus Daviesbacteria bacterium GW2011_GWC1_40_9]KKR83718.1 MAG: putative ribonuclease VapC [Candidatus Daviesbacteria bacterium GW2011_GWA2_40_9]KKR93687.1 MAG: putative ribonuclease VapC [Candidatus Daviesbacteria bacterium GW2011_GWB1_41_15]KKS15153.1 MAG: putative ribonuclease VapC [Candidatus Daviesbacteria bacterium GW2011_GWA1_41_61]